MPRERVFDHEITISMNTGGTATEGCSTATVQKKLMLRIEKHSETNEPHRYFTVELYDENNFDFLYCGKFTRTRFEEVKRVQRLKFSMDQAPKIIVNFVQSLADDRKRFVNCSIVEPAPTTQVPGMGERSKTVCRFELMCRSEFKEMSELTLELDRVHGEQLNQHLIQFIDKYKRKADEMSSLRDQVSNLQLELQEERSHHKTQEEELRSKIDEYEDQVNELLEELREKTDELKAVEAELEVHQSQLKTLKVSYQRLMNEHDRVIGDNQRFVAELDELELQMEHMRNELREATDSRDQLIRDCRAKDTQLKKCRLYIDELRKGITISEAEIAALQKKLKERNIK